ncbi:MAG: S-layer homology domain-containing protein [Candidatus Peregrinibacteria bacterium]
MCRKHIRLLGILSFMGVLTFIVAGSPSVFASTTDGTIDTTNRYAWSENFGWIDFGTAEGDVHVTDSALSGYAWGETAGWISLNCSNTSSCGTVDYKVTNDGEGTLGGHAWSENFGWIQFAPTNGGVTIDATGKFTGYAWGENVGWIVFNCATTSTCGTVAYRVATDWCSSSVRASLSSSSAQTQSTTVSPSGGHRGSPAQMATRIAQAQTTILARFEGKRQQSERLVADEEQRTADTRLLAGQRRKATQEDRAAAQRESRITKRIEEYEISVAQIAKEQEELRQKYEQHREERYAKALALEQQRLARSQAALLAEQQALTQEQEANRLRREERLAEHEKLLKEQEELALETPSSRSAASPFSTSAETIAVRRDRLYAFVDETPVIYMDVPLSAWYAPYVSYVIEEKIATGYADEAGKPTGEFGVEKPITYAEVLKMAMQASAQAFDLRGLPPPRNDTAKGTWASAYVSKAEALNLIVFAPNLDVQKPATRGAVIQTILEVLGFPIPKTLASFDDVPSSHPYSQAIGLAAYSGLVTGDTTADGTLLNRFRPDDPINRAEVAKIIALAKELLK